MKKISNWNLLGVIFHLIILVIFLFEELSVSSQYELHQFDYQFLLYHGVAILLFLSSYVLTRRISVKYFLIGFVAYYLQAAFLIVQVAHQVNGNILVMRILCGVYLVFCLVLLFPLRKMSALAQNTKNSKREDILDDE